MQLQAIRTKFVGPRNLKPARVKAWCCGGSVTIDYRHDFFEYDSHKMAFVKLAKKLKWDKYTWHAGCLEDGYVFVNEGE